MSTIDPLPPTIGTDETAETGKSAIVLAALFIVVEILLMAETIGVILHEGSEDRYPGQAPVAILLSTALLANLGLVCTVIAGSAANVVRRSRRAEVISAAMFSAVICSAEVAPSADAAPPDIAASSDMPTSG